MENSFYAVTCELDSKKLIFVMELKEDAEKGTLRCLPYHNKVSFEGTDFSPVGNSDYEKALEYCERIKKITKKSNLRYQGLEGRITEYDVSVKEIDCIMDANIN